MGLNVPRLTWKREKAHYQSLQKAIEQGLVASTHGIYRGGLGVHLTLAALAGDLGMEVDLAKVPVSSPLSSDRVLFSESCGRMILSRGLRKIGRNLKRSWEVVGCNMLVGFEKIQPFI